MNQTALDYGTQTTEQSVVALIPRINIHAF